MASGKDRLEAIAGVFNIDEKYRRLLLAAYKAMAVPSILVAAMILYDIVAPPSFTDMATVTRKYERIDKGIKLHVAAEGRFRHNEIVDRGIYDLLDPGDVVAIRMTKFFQEAKTIQIVETGAVTASAGGDEMLAMGWMGLLFLGTLAPYFKGAAFFSKQNLLYIIGVPGLGFVAVIILIKYWLVTMGVIDRI